MIHTPELEDHELLVAHHAEHHAELAQYDLLKKVNADLLEACEEIRDLARTGVAPDAFNMTAEDWARYKCNKIAAIATHAIAKAKGKQA